MGRQPRSPDQHLPWLDVETEAPVPSSTAFAFAHWRLLQDHPVLHNGPSEASAMLRGSIHFHLYPMIL